MNILFQLFLNLKFLQLAGWHLDQATSCLTLRVTATQTVVCCPVCAQPSPRIHSRYQRIVADLPWAAFRLILHLNVRKFFCVNDGCQRRIFTERLPEVVAPWARRTQRLAERLTQIGLALGGAAGAWLSHRLGIGVCRNTLLALVRRASPPSVAGAKIVGVDDFAFHKHHTYGTILVDLQTRRPLALLEDREAETLAQWLREHPGIEVITRDRSSAYADGARQGAPHATQVADRFHLLHNLAETLEVVFGAHGQALEAVNAANRQAPVIRKDGTEAVPIPPPPAPAPAQTRAAQRRAERLTRFERVWELHRQGWSGYAIARHLGIGKSTVFRYLRSATFPERQSRSDRGRSVLDPYQAYFRERWNDGCHDAMRLFHELKAQGYLGSYPSVARYAQRLRQAQGITGANRHPRTTLPQVAEPQQRPLTARGAAWLVMRRPDKRHANHEPHLTQLKAQHAELAVAIALTQDFADLVRHRWPEKLDDWLARAAASSLAPFRGFAKRLWADYDAVKAGVTFPWSNGPVEGQINRLKMLKRTMFGRAKLDLLSRRFLLAK